MGPWKGGFPFTQNEEFDPLVLVFSQGCSSPMVVKFADTQKDKEQKRMAQQLQQQMLHGPCYIKRSEEERKKKT